MRNVHNGGVVLRKELFSQQLSTPVLWVDSSSVDSKSKKKKFNLNILQYSNTQQHTAAYCSILKHTATHCSAPRHTATHCNALQRTAPHCNTVALPRTSIWVSCDQFELGPWLETDWDSKREKIQSKGLLFFNVCVRVYLSVCVCVCVPVCACHSPGVFSFYLLNQSWEVLAKDFFKSAKL